MHKPARLTQLPTPYCLRPPPWAPTALEKISPQPRLKWSWWQMRSWDRKCKGNARASASSFELWRYLVSISGTIYLTGVCDFVFVCFSSLSITLAVKLSVSGRFTIRGNKSTPKKIMLRPVSFYTRVNILSIPLFLCSLKCRKKKGKEATASHP